MIELMIVVAIIGILAAIAIPAYQIYIVRSKVTEGLVVAASAKTIVVENAANGFPLNQGWRPISPTRNVASIEVDADNGQISMIYSAEAKSVKLILAPQSPPGTPLAAGEVPGNQVSWVCKVLDASQARYVPNECRNT